MNDRWIFLSYPLSDKYSSYGDGERIDLQAASRIEDGSSNNSSKLFLSSHFGTHIDFPYHFDNRGKSGENYPPEQFIFNAVMVVYITDDTFENWLITYKNFKKISFPENIDLLLIKTGFSEKRMEDYYWENYPGLHSDLAQFFKDRMPGLKAVGLDTISISSWQNRHMGRLAHKSFLTDHEVLIIEDMDLSKLNPNIVIETIIVSPLRFENSDGAPVTVFAKLNSE